MTREEIIRLAQQTGVVPTREGALEQFVAAITNAHEKETKMMSEKEQLFRLLVKLDDKSHKYLDSVPTDIRSAIFDNEYSQLISQQLNATMEVAFGEHFEAVSWFLYEWLPGMCAYDGEKEIAIQNIDQYIEFLKRCEGFE